MRLIWSRHAIEDRRAIYDYIEKDDPRLAAVVDERIQAAALRLIDFPESGRPGRVQDTRELVIPRTPFIAPYHSTDAGVRILRVIHGAQIWPVELPDE